MDGGENLEKNIIFQCLKIKVWKRYFKRSVEDKQNQIQW